MNAPAASSRPARPPAAIEKYYQLHAHIYDATRWSFLFGRTGILRDIAAAGAPARILEAGCGTGQNIANLGRMFPHAQVTGVDLSEPMLERARRATAAFGGRVRLKHGAYGAGPGEPGGFDLVLFSYALTMFNPGFEQAIEAAHRDLAPGGHIAVVDFHDTRLRLFERWMRVNHVRMNGQLRPILQERFEPHADRLHTAYGGVWRYLMFVGRKSANE
jgi:S-adenosylmethionine-diacylgycerolhomoserine-N-methlytransferase